jgi:hypothetical protein
MRTLILVVLFEPLACCFVRIESSMNLWLVVLFKRLRSSSMNLWLVVLFKRLRSSLRLLFYSSS